MKFLIYLFFLCFLSCSSITENRVSCYLQDVAIYQDTVSSLSHEGDWWVIQQNNGNIIKMNGVNCELK